MAFVVEIPKILFSPAPLAAGIVLFILLKYRTAIGHVLQLLGQESEFLRKHEGATQVRYVSAQFLRVGALYDKLLDEKIVTPEQYRAWATFATHFKKVYPQIVRLWSEALSGGTEIGNRTRAETLALTKGVVELETAAYRHLASAAAAAPAPPPPIG